MKKFISLFLVLLLTITLAACGGNDTDIPEDILDCITDPTDERCEDIIPDPTDDRSAEEIAADYIIEVWDGDVTHLNNLLELMDFTQTMELEAEFNFEVLDNDGDPHIINVVLTDSFVFLEGGDILERHLNLNIDGELLELTMVFEEVATGVVIYLEISGIRDRLVIDEPEADAVLDVLGVDQDWLMLSFDDSLTNMIEIEVMREMLADIFFGEMGANFFYDLQDQIQDDTELVLADYNLDIGLLMDALATGDYTAFETMLNNIDFDTLLIDLDDAVVVPALVAFMQDKQLELEAEGFDVVGSIVFIELNGTELFLQNLNNEELLVFIEILTTDDWERLERAMMKLQEEIPWQVISVINLPTEDLENGATIVWHSDRPELITAEGVVTAPAAGEWNQWANLTAIITVGEEQREMWFQVTVPPVDAIDVGDEYHDYYYDDDYDRDDPIGDYLKETVDIYEVILLIQELKDALLLVDFSALELETIDLEALKDAVYQSQAAYDAFIIALATTAPEIANILGAFSPVVGYLEEYVFLTDVRYALDNITMFDKYLTLEYYMDNDLLDVAIDKTDTFAIETTVSIAPMAFGVLFVNALEDVSTFAGGITEFEIPYIEHINCPDPLPQDVVCETFDEYSRIIERLNLLSNMEMVALYDPSNLTELEMKLDFTAFADAIINMPLYDDELLDRAVDKLYQQMPWQVIAVIDLPTVDLENEATITWASDRPDLISAAGVVTAPPIDEWDQWVMLTATVTVGGESEDVYFHITVPPVNAEGVGDEYDNYYDDNNGGMDIDTVTDLSLTITISETAAVTVPTTYNDVNAIAEDFARFSLSMMAYDYLDRIANYYIENPDLLLLDFGETKSLVYYVDDFYVTPAFDDVLSEVVIGGDLLNGPTFSIQLVWVDGLDVFDTPLTLAELVLVVGPNTGGPESNTVFQYYIDKVNDANFNMTKLIFVYIFNDTYDDDEYYEEEYNEE